MTDTTSGALVPYLVEVFRAQAWIAMGKVAHPVSGEVERDLVQARAFIDLLGEVEVKTRGNVTDEEARILSGVLTELRMNFMEESKKPDPEPSAATDGETGGTPADENPADASAYTGSPKESE